jgi:hypothetical protein
LLSYACCMSIALAAYNLKYYSKLLRNILEKMVI